MKSIFAAVVIGALALSTCSKGNAEPEVREALNQHLQKKGNLALNNMDMNIENVKVNGDTADAQVKFQSKQRPELAVTIHYVLKRTGDHWEVASSSPMSGMGGDPHGSSAMGSDSGSAPAPAPDASGAPKPESSH